MTVDIDLKKTIDTSYKIFIDALPALTFDKKVAVVTNPTVSGLHLEYLLERLVAPAVEVITLPDGEQYKNWESIETVLGALFEARFNRSSVLIAFGGGVIGDMTGFAASIFQRGIDFIQIPTTLLSQVDASVGGKTGINNRYGKNLVGAFHQPIAVYADPHFLKTLPPREFAAGVAEIVKMAVTFDAEFFAWLESADLSQPDQLAEAVARSVQTKASVVAQDEKERGLRAALNYGHTFGHVIENETNYTTYLHGETVAIGMVMANRLAVELELMDAVEAERVERLLQRYDLPVRYAIADVEAFYEAFFLDKKSGDNSITFILPHHLGGVVMPNDIDRDTVLKILRGFAGDAQ
ncbi:3-dehydroquinate synthase [Sulfurimonas sp. HSL-1656]|uniref:3-dehydroquinate synthase n=1 Tax=Thiomicrolovo subterrani TaxID=3131934 RepID=UPI0031F89C0F